MLFFLKEKKEKERENEEGGKNMYPFRKGVIEIRLSGGKRKERKKFIRV